MLLHPEDSLPEIRAFLAASTGKTILHLSDTPTALYPAAEALAREIRPDVLIHTGDCADEHKAGRREADIPAYREAVPNLFAALTKYAGRVCVVPGNNDLPEVLSALPGVEVVPEWSQLEVDGVRLELSHFPNPSAFGVDFALYGHGSADDLRYGLPEDGRHLNGNFDFSLIDTGSKRVLRIPYREKIGCMRIFIVRHGQPEALSVVDGNPDLPKGDPPLTRDGVRQAKYLAMELQKRRFAGKIYSSPFLRALQTAQQTARMLGAPVLVEKDIREIAKKTTLAPDFRGETIEEMKRRIPEIAPECELAYPWWDHTPEKADDVLARVAPFLEKLIERGEDAVIFAHGAVVNASIRYLMQRNRTDFPGYYPMPPRSNCALTEFRLTGKKIRTICVNGTDHLPAELISSNAEYALTSRKKWQLTQMHLHADCEEKASFRSHAAQAAALGYDAIYITEHDTRMNEMPGCIRSFRPEKAGDAVNEKMQGWYTESGAPFRAEERDGRVFLPLHPGKCAVFDGKKKQQVSLLADVTLELEARIPAGGELTADVRLSQCPDLTDRHLVYTTCAEAPSAEWCVPLQKTGENLYSMPLSADALRFDPEFGPDNAFLTVTLSGEAEVGELTIRRKYTAEALRQRMRELAERVGAAYGLTVIPCFELTFGLHANCFSADTPVIDYGKTGYVEGPQTGTAYLRAKGALFAKNHPFGAYRKDGGSHEAVFARAVEELAASRCDGAQLIEVGFPEGRYGFSLEEHLRLWDELALRGVFLIGYGDSDSHNSKKGWRDGNCFGTWILAENTAPASLEKALRAGTVCFGDPNRFGGSVTLTAERSRMGSVLTCSPDAKKQVTVRVTGAAGCTLRLIVHGEVFLTQYMKLGELELKIPVCLGDRPYSLVRAEILGPDEKIIYCTNPVFLKKSD